jgi:adenylate cyclase
LAGSWRSERAVLRHSRIHFDDRKDGAGSVDRVAQPLFRSYVRGSDRRGGLINKFGGDSLLAVFGTPLNPTRDHAAQAVRAAQGMLAALDTFNADQTARGEPTLRIGVGVASGAVVAGNVGSEERLEYTVIGDTVNLASRLQTMTKELGVPLLMSESTVQQLADRESYVAIGQVDVRGKQAPVSVFTLHEGGEACG